MKPSSYSAVSTRFAAEPAWAAECERAVQDLHRLEGEWLATLDALTASHDAVRAPSKSRFTTW